MSRLFLFFLLFLGVSLKQVNAQLSEKDLKFVEQAWDAGLLQQKIADLAKSKAQNPDVKAFAEKLALDYEAANASLKKFANDRHVNLPVNPVKGTQSKIDKLSSKNGKAFDNQFTSLVISEHKSQGSKYEEAFTKAADENLRKWALQRWPVLASHELEAEVAQEKIK